MKKDETYEYKMLALDPDRPETDKEINKLGKKGFKLVSVLKHNDEWCMHYFEKIVK